MIICVHASSAVHVYRAIDDLFKAKSSRQIRTNERLAAVLLMKVGLSK